jgi:hypothetical protein
MIVCNHTGMNPKFSDLEKCHGNSRSGHSPKSPSKPGEGKAAGPGRLEGKPNQPGQPLSPPKISRLGPGGGDFALDFGPGASYSDIVKYLFRDGKLPKGATLESLGGAWRLRFDKEVPDLETRMRTGMYDRLMSADRRDMTAQEKLHLQQQKIMRDAIQNMR